MAVTSSSLRGNRYTQRLGVRFARLYNFPALCGRRRDGELRTSCGSSRQKRHSK